MGFTVVGGAEPAGVLLGETAAGGAGNDVVGERSEEGAEFFQLGRLPSDELKGKTLSGAAADTGELFEVGNEGVEGFRIFRVHEIQNTGWPIFYARRLFFVSGLIINNSVAHTAILFEFSHLFVEWIHEFL